MLEGNSPQRRFHLFHLLNIASSNKREVEVLGWLMVNFYCGFDMIVSVYLESAKIIKSRGMYRNT